MGVSFDTNGLVGFSTNGIGLYAQSVNGVGSIANITSLNVSNIAEFKKNNVNQAYITQNGTIVSNKSIINTTVDNGVDKLQVLGKAKFGTGTVDATGFGGMVSISSPSNTQNSLFLLQSGVGSAHIGFKPNDSNLHFVNSYANGFISDTTSMFLSSNGNLALNTAVDNGVDKLQVNGSLIATSIKKTGGLSTQFLMADGSVTTGGGGSQNLQQVTDVGSTTTNNITANSFIKSGGTSSQFLKANGSVDSTTYLSAIPTLQQVTTAGATTTTPININGISEQTGLGINLISDANGLIVNTNTSTTIGVPIGVSDEFENFLFSVGHNGSILSENSITSSTVILSPTILVNTCLLYTSPSPRDRQKSRMPSSA